MRRQNGVALTRDFIRKKRDAVRNFMKGKNSKAAQSKPADSIDNSFVKELEESGFIDASTAETREV